MQFAKQNPNPNRTVLVPAQLVGVAITLKTPLAVSSIMNYPASHNNRMACRDSLGTGQLNGSHSTCV
jgi:hypothetical protein